MKTGGHCPKCAGTRIVRLPYLIDAGDWTGSGSGKPTDRSGGQYVPRLLAIAEETRTSTGLFGGTSTQIVERQIATEAYVCADCGLVEEHVVDPGAIPWDEVQGARWHTPG